MSDQGTAPVHLAATLDGLAENPALPAGLVRRLLADRRPLGRVANRPDLTADLIAEIIAIDDHWLLHSLALNPHLPHTVRLRLAKHTDPAIRRALVIGGRNGPRDLFERLVNDPDRQVREHLAEGDTVPADLRASLARDPDPRVRATLARWWPQAPEHVRRILLTDPVDHVRAYACSTYYARSPDPVPPADLLPDLLDDPVTRAGAVQHVNLTVETALRLSTDPDDKVRQQLAKHPQLPPDLRDQLAEDPYARVRVAIFARFDTPEPTRYRIYSGIKRGPGPSDGLDDEARRQWYNACDAITELTVLYLPWVAADPLPHVTSPYVCFRRSAACSPSLPVDAVTRLLNDDESMVRTTMALTAPHLVDGATAERIIREFRPFAGWRDPPADDFTFPPETLRRFATDPDPRMRCLAPRDLDLPADLAERLATDPDSEVRHAVAAHPRLPTHALLTLLADHAEWVARAAAASPSLPVADMEHLLLLAGL